MVKYRENGLQRHRASPGTPKKPEGKNRVHTEVSTGEVTTAWAGMGLSSAGRLLDPRWHYEQLLGLAGG